MKVYALHIGDTTVPYGHFYGGIGDEWTGWRGTRRFLTDKGHPITTHRRATLDGPRLRDGTTPRFVPPQPEDAAGSVAVA